MKYEICYIDDRSYALPQVIYSIAQEVDYELYYYQRIWDIEERDFDLVILDFYLDKDSKTALDIIDRFQGIEIIAFSSVASKNTLMLENGAIYSVEKLQGTNNNPQLKKVMENIFPKPGFLL